MIIILTKKGGKAMKETYKKPEFDVKDFAQFENVFTACNREYAGRKKSSDPMGGCMQNKPGSNNNTSNFGDIVGS